MKKTIGAVIAFLLILGALGGGNLQYLTDWSSGQVIGFNVATLAELVVGGYLVYWALIKATRKKEIRSTDTNNYR